MLCYGQIGRLKTLSYTPAIECLQVTGAGSKAFIGGSHGPLGQLHEALLDCWVKRNRFARQKPLFRVHAGIERIVVIECLKQLRFEQMVYCFWVVGARLQSLLEIPDRLVILEVVVMLVAALGQGFKVRLVGS